MTPFVSSEAEPNSTTFVCSSDNNTNNSSSTAFLLDKARKLLRGCKRKSSPCPSCSVNSPLCEKVARINTGISSSSSMNDPLLEMSLGGNKELWEMYWLERNDLVIRLRLLESRVALARVLFPREARLALEIANAHSTSELAGLAASKASCGNLREVDLNELPYEQGKRLQLRLQALQKNVETSRRFFPNCFGVLDRFSEDDMQETLLLEKGPPEEQCVKKTRYMELKDEVMKAFHKDKAENK